MSNKKDNLFKQKNDCVDFIFDKSVVDVFDDMLFRSVPFYKEAQRMMAELAVAYAQHGSVVYDLGCSHGNTAFMIANTASDKKIKIVGIDNSKEMIKAANIRKKNCKQVVNLSFEYGDITEPMVMKNASVAIMSLTLQFIRPARRLGILKHIYQSLKPNGALILLEKNIVHDSDLNRLFIDLYYKFKRRNNYSDMEISKKRVALENVLIPYSIEENIGLLKSAGFAKTASFFQWYNFSGLIAIKKSK